METIRTIKLYGPLAAKFGHVHRLAVNSVAEASRALCVLIPGFEKFLMESKDRGLGFAIYVDRENIGEKRLSNNLGNAKEIRIAPVVTGSKKGGFLKIVAGVILIVVGYIVTGLSYGWAAPVGNAMIGMGVSMIVGGITQLLAPQPKQSEKEKNEKTSYAFNGPVNVSAQGASVPVLYGLMFTGSVVVSAGINAVDNYVVPNKTDPYSNGKYSDGDSMWGDVISRSKNEYQ